jgi:fatty-acyl-CoA synthase
MLGLLSDLPRENCWTIALSAAPQPSADWLAPTTVPDPVSGDQVMAALALRESARFEPDAFAAFLAGQPDLGTKMTPRFVRIVTSTPVTATNKVHRAQLRREGFRCADPVWWSPPDAGRCGAVYRPLTADDLATLLAAYRDHGREALLDH